MKKYFALCLLPLAVFAADDPFAIPQPQQSADDVLIVSKADPRKFGLSVIYAALGKIYTAGDKQEPVQLKQPQEWKSGKIIKIVGKGQYLLTDCLVKALPGQKVRNEGDTFMGACVKESGEYKASNGLMVPVYQAVPSVTPASHDMITAWLKAGYKLKVTVIEQRPDQKAPPVIDDKGRVKSAPTVPTAVTYTVTW